MSLKSDVSFTHLRKKDKKRVYQVTPIRKEQKTNSVNVWEAIRKELKGIENVRGN